MNNPRDFLPAKYKKKQVDTVDDESIKDRDTYDSIYAAASNKNVYDSPWIDLAKEPKIPEYRNTNTLNLNDVDLKSNSEKGQIGDLNSVKTGLSDVFGSSLTSQPAATPKKKSNGKLAGLLVVFFLVIGVFSSYLLSKQNQDNRQQASVSDPYEESSSIVGCVSGYYACNVGCCGTGGTPTEGKRYSPILGTDVTWDSTQNNSDLSPSIREAIRVELKSRGLLNDNGTIRLTESYTLENYFTSENGKKVYDYCYSGGNLDTSKCQLVTGGYLYIGGSGFSGDPCAPLLTGGADWCQVIGGKSALCIDLGLIRCACNNGIGVIGSSGQTCDNLCGGTNNVCESCTTTSTPETPLTDTPTPTTTPTTTPTPEMPVCSSIEILNINNNIMTTDDDKDLQTGDEVRFRCSAVGNQNVDFNYEFRIWAPGTTAWTNITDTSGTVAKNISGKYIIAGPGHYVAQGRICVGSECQTWEIIEGAPASTAAASTPTPTNTPTPTQSTSCTKDSDCANGYTCYQPPMPTCAVGTFCNQVIPNKYCKAK